MVTLKATYENRKQEIIKFVGLMSFLEKKKAFPEENEVNFDEFFYNGVVEIQLSYQELINILK